MMKIYTIYLFSLTSYGYTPDKQRPHNGHDGEVGPGVGGVGGAKQCTGGDEAGEDKVKERFHING